MEHFIVEAFLIGLVIFSEVRNYIERKGLLNRILARDLPELVTYERELKKPHPLPNQPLSGGIEL